MRMTTALDARLLIASLALLSACASPPRPPLTQQAGVAPTMTIERFLRAVNENDLDTMSGLFGTRDGAIDQSWPREESDARMFLLASILRHSDYSILSEQIVPGRREEATQFLVSISTSEQQVTVPFTLVRTGEHQHWLIEQIGIESVTR
ncbi:MAG: hypothetical protein WD054_05715 [Gemmatimonadota bacterium]